MSGSSPRSVATGAALFAVLATVDVLACHFVLTAATQLPLLALKCFAEDDLAAPLPTYSSSSNDRIFVGLVGRDADLVTQRIMRWFWRPVFGVRPDGMDERWQRCGFNVGRVDTQLSHVLQ